MRGFSHINEEKVKEVRTAGARDDHGGHRRLVTIEGWMGIHKAM